MRKIYTNLETNGSLEQFINHFKNSDSKMQTIYATKKEGYSNIPDKKKRITLVDASLVLFLLLMFSACTGIGQGTEYKMRFNKPVTQSWIESRLNAPIFDVAVSSDSTTYWFNSDAKVIPIEAFNFFSDEVDYRLMECRIGQVDSILTAAFNATAIEYFHCPQSLKYIGPAAFGKTESLREFSYNHGIEVIDRNVFNARGGEVWKNRSLYIPETVRLIKSNAFSSLSPNQLYIGSDSLELEPESLRLKCRGNRQIYFGNYKNPHLGPTAEKDDLNGFTIECSGKLQIIVPEHWMNPVDGDIKEWQRLFGDRLDIKTY